MKIKEVLNEDKAEKEFEKLKSFLKKAARGGLTQQGMLGAGFNLRNPNANKESRLANTLSAYLGSSVTEDDIEKALKELKIRDISVIADKWNEAASKRRD